MVRDHQVATSFVAAGFLGAALLHKGHQNALERMYAEREAREQVAYEAAVNDALHDAKRLGEIAKAAARQLAKARAENAKLKRALAQREGYIARMRGQL